MLYLPARPTENSNDYWIAWPRGRVPEHIVFEQPLNEKCLAMPRLTHLFEQFDYHMPYSTPRHARVARLDIPVIPTHGFMDSSNWEHPVQTAHNTIFKLNICTI